MNRSRTSKLLATVLTAVLLLQLSVQTYHILVQHSADRHTSKMSLETTMGDPSFACDTCDSFLWNTLYFSAFLALGAIYSGFPRVISFNELTPEQSTITPYSLRGPPSICLL